jgi:hypothetical protein
VIDVPPVLAGADQLIDTCASPIDPDTPVGAPGAVAGTIALETVDAAEVPMAFMALTRNV